MSESFLENLYMIYEALRANEKEHALCIFAFIAESYYLSEQYIQPVVMAKFVTLLTQLITDVARPSFFSEEVTKEYFSLLTNLIQRSPRLFASDAGTEYLAVFACSSNSLFGSNAGANASSPKAFFERQVKKVLLSFKQRDMLDQ